MNSLINYSLLNKLAKKHGVVMFGSSYMNNVPVTELLQDYGINTVFYKRCVEGMKIEEAEKNIDTCIAGLLPDKIIINMGEEDLCDGCNIEKLIEDYRWLLYNIHAKLPVARLYVTSVISEHEKTEELNAEIKKLAAENGCEYIKLYDGTDLSNVEVELVKRLKPVFYRNNINYNDLANEVLLDLMIPY